MFDFLLFDLDGTLTDSSQGILNSFKYAFTKMGVEIPSYETLLTFIGPPLPYTFGTLMGMSAEKADEAVVKYREYYADKGLFENRVYEGIPEALQKIKATGRKLGVATSKPEEFSRRIIKKFNLEQYFDCICGSNMDETRGGKAEIIAYALETLGVKDKSKVLMIGDRHHDIDGAKANGLKSCGVLYGFGDREELEKAGADYIVSAPGNICDII